MDSSFDFTELKESSSPVSICTQNQIPTWQSVFFSFIEHSTVLSSSPVCPFHLLNALLAKLLRILSDSVSFELIAKFLQLHLVPVLNAHLAKPYKNPKRLCNCVFSHTAFPPEVFINLTGLLLDLLISVRCLNTSLSEPAVFKSASSCARLSEPATFSHTLLA
jgi:hypothetical protein